MKRMLSRLRLTPKGRLRRNVVILLLVPLVLLLAHRPCFTRQEALERIQETYHFGPVDAAQWHPEAQAYVLRYDRWYAVCPLERGRFYFWDTWEPGLWGLTPAPVEDAPLSVCAVRYSGIVFGLCTGLSALPAPAAEAPAPWKPPPARAGCSSTTVRRACRSTSSTPPRPWTAGGRCSAR